MLQVSKHSPPEPGEPRGPRGAVEIGGVSLTERQGEYVREVAKGTKGMLAAELAGFGCPESQHCRLSRDPKIQHAIAAEMHRLVAVELAPLAYRTMTAIITSESTPPGVAFKASQWALETAGIRPQQAGDGQDGHGKALEDLSLAELEAIAAQARKRLETIPAIEGEARTIQQHEQQQTRQSDEPEQAAKPATAGYDPLT